MSDRAGPKSSSSDFEWPEWHQGQDGGETRRSATASAPPSDASADSDPGEPEQGTYAPSDKPPPVIEAFPEQTNHYEPPPEPDDEPRDIPWPLTVTIIAACIAVVALIAVLVGIITNRGDSSGPSTAQSTTSPSATTSPPVTVTSEETQTQTQTVTVTPTLSSTPAPAYYPPSGSSLQQLQQQVRSDHDVVLRGATSPDRWMPQLGSKKLGTVADGKSYSYDDILANYYQLKRKYPGARLLWSGDWSTFGESDYWVTVANITAPTPDDALSWCRTNVGPDNNNCYAKLISTTHPVDGSTAYQ
jgi:serine/threonine-protein kinase